MNVIIIIIAENENAANTAIKGTENDNNCITLTKIKLILFINNAVLKNIKIKVILITIL